MTIGTISSGLDAAIESAVQKSTTLGLVGILKGAWPRSTSGLPLFIKYTSAKFGGIYAPIGPKAASPKPPGLFVSATIGYTWGTACYVSPLLYPVSTAIYGRCGVVAEADPSNWRIFDASDLISQQFYIDWLNAQPYARLLMLTTHSQLANQFLRDRFRTQYRIDCVVFPPDEINPYYTRHRQDRWLAITQWGATGEIASSQTCTVFQNPRLASVIAEEFECSHNAMGRRALIGPTSTPLNHVSLANDIAKAYNTSTIATVTA
jgi:hypothetical protein